MGFLKKVGTALKKVIKPNGLLSKVVSKIPVIGGIASGAIDVIGGIVQKISPSAKGTASKPTAGQSFVENYQAVAGATASSAVDRSLLLQYSAQSPIVNRMFLWIGLGVAAVMALILIFSGRKKRRR
jgi:hypothetical protein